MKPFAVCCSYLYWSVLLVLVLLGSAASRGKDKSGDDVDSKKHHSAISVFKSCDNNLDGRLSRQELAACLSLAKEQGLLGLDLANDYAPGGGGGDGVVFALFDLDKDGYIQLTEYIDVQSKISGEKAGLRSESDLPGEGRSLGSDRVRLKNRFGVEEEVTREEMFRRSSQVGKDFQKKDGKLFKQHAGMMNVSNITDPSLKRFVTIGQYSLHELKQQKFAHANSSLVNLESLPTGGIASLSKINLEKEKQSGGSSSSPSLSSKGYSEATLGTNKFEVWLVLTLKSGISMGTENETDKSDKASTGEPKAPGKKRVKSGKMDPSTLDRFEVRVAYDKAAYPSPHLALLEAWRIGLNEDKSRDNDIDIDSIKKAYTRISSVSLRPPKERATSVSALFSRVISTVQVGLLQWLGSRLGLGVVAFRVALIIVAVASVYGIYRCLAVSETKNKTRETRPVEKVHAS